MSAAMTQNELTTPAPIARYNIYSIIHKALRGWMTDVLHRWGRMDVEDECERNQAIENVRALLDVLAAHLRHENDVVHPAIEKSRQSGAARTAQDHVEHEHAIARLGNELATFASARPELRASLAHSFYLHLSAFVAENFEHMVVEETENHRALIAAYSEREVLELEHRIVSSLPPEESAATMRWMLAYINAAERAFLVGNVKRNAPPAVLAGILGMAREILSQRDMFKLEKALSA